MPPFLLDANLSPETRVFLVNSFGIDVTDLMSLGLSHLRDAEVVELAKREGRVIITLIRTLARFTTGESEVGWVSSFSG